METIGSTVRGSEPANAVDNVCCAKLGAIATEIQPRKAKVVSVVEGAVRESGRLESPQECDIVLEHRSVCRSGEAGVENERPV